MTVKIEYKGTNVDDAINLACAKLNVSREQLDIDVLAPGSNGIFGFGKKKAVIQACRKESETQDSVREEKKRERQPRKKNRQNLGPLKQRPRGTGKKIDSILEKVDEALTKSVTPEAGDQIKQILVSILDLMGYASQVTISMEGNKVCATIEQNEHIEVLIGREGSTLDAIQYLMRKIISQKFVEKIFFSLDAGDYRANRKKELQELALDIATKVKECGKSRTVSALNPAERRIVHVTLQNDDTIRSASIGEGLFKKIRIYLPGKGRRRSYRKSRNNRTAK